MSSYIVLRNNKESGPHSLAGLQQLGLKPNDLVWVEGQSMAWLPLREIPSLKGLISDAPVASQSAYQPKVQENVVEADDIPSPANKTIVTSSIHPIKETPVVAETKYARSLDEIKEKYVNDLEQRKKWTNRNKILFGQLKKASVYGGLVVLGLIAGFLLKRSGSKKTVVANQESHQPAVVNTKTEEPVTVIGSTTTLPEQGTENKEQETRNREQEIRNKEQANKEQGIRNQQQVLPEQEKTVANTEKSTSVKEHLAKNAPVENISSLVSVKTNDYTVASFGGIRDLVLTVKNDSKYFLDNVVVELQYLKPRDVLLKSEDIKFPSVPPNSTQVVAVKKSNRGVKVAVKIKQIESKELNNPTAGL